MQVRQFKYAQPHGRIMLELAHYHAQFIRWTNTPGIAECVCSDGRIRHIPDFALEGERAKQLPPQTP